MGETAGEPLDAVSRLVGRAGTVLRTNTWLARHAMDLKTFRTMRQGASSRTDTLVRLRGIEPIGVRAHTTDLVTVWELFHRGEYDSTTPIRPRTVVDLGANVGTFLAFIVARAGDAIEHYVGVEADAGSFAALEAQADRMAMRDRVTLVNAAVWGESGQVRFADSGAEWGRSVVSSGGTLVEALTVTDLLDRAGMATCELMKMDIEGAENLVLPTIGDWVHRVEVLTVELHGQSDRWLAEQVEAAGYRSLPRGALFRHHPAAVREDVTEKWLAAGCAQFA